MVKSNSYGQSLFLGGAIALVFGVAVLLPIAVFTQIFMFLLLDAIDLALGVALIALGAYLIPNDIGSA